VAAPAGMGCDAAGNFHQAWGGAGKRLQLAEREHGSISTTKGWGGSAATNCPTSGLAGSSRGGRRIDESHAPDGKSSLQIGAETKNAIADNRQRAIAPRMMGESARPTEVFVADVREQPRIVFDADTGAFKRMWGAFGKPRAAWQTARSSRRKVFRRPKRSAATTTWRTPSAWPTTGTVYYVPLGRTGGSNVHQRRKVIRQ